MKILSASPVLAKIHLQLPEQVAGRHISSKLLLNLAACNRNSSVGKL